VDVVVSQILATIVDHRLNSAEGSVLDLRGVAANIEDRQPAASVIEGGHSRGFSRSSKYV
jgi:hypothetical protein